MDLLLFVVNYCRNCGRIKIINNHIVCSRRVEGCGLKIADRGQCGMEQKTDMPENMPEKMPENKPGSVPENVPGNAGYSGNVPEKAEMTGAGLQAGGQLIDDRQREAIAQDALQVAEFMKERNAEQGAYCQDINVFREIFRFMERRMKRQDISAFIILFTMIRPHSGFLDRMSRQTEMNRLGGCIRDSLRLSDLYTQYSSNQYLVMLCDLTEENAEKIAVRIAEQFTGQDHPGNNVILHHCFPLKPTGSL